MSTAYHLFEVAAVALAVGSSLAYALRRPARALAARLRGRSGAPASAGCASCSDCGGCAAPAPPAEQPVAWMPPRR